MLFRRKKCILYAQMRQLVTYYTYTSQAKAKPVYDCTKFKYSYVTNTSFDAHRLLCSQPANESYIPPLMQMYIPSSYNALYIFKSTIILTLYIDKNFNLLEFVKGVKQAIVVISHALSNQNYEVLDGMITKRTLKILKHRVDRLTLSQRDFLKLDENNFVFLPIFMAAKRNKHDAIVQVGIKGNAIYKQPNSIDYDVYNVTFGYVFQRKYINGVGGEWVIRYLNYTAKDI